METCARCGAELGVGRFCLNCGHPVGAPVPEDVAAGELTPAAALSAQRAPWPFWAGVGLAAAVVLAVLVWALVWVLSGDSDPSTASTDQSPSPSPQTPTTQQPPTPGPVLDLTDRVTVTVPATATATTGLDGTPVSFGSSLMLDGDPTTAWRMDGDGTGAKLTIDLEPGFAVTEVGMVNGYAKREAGVDWYPGNRRILVARWRFDGGERVKQTLRQTPQPQTTEVPEVATDKITLTLVRVSPPGTGQWGRDFTAISEIVVNGRRVG